MKIFYPLLCYYPSQNGGPANTLFWLHNELEKQNINCVVTSTEFGLPKDFKFNKGIYGPKNDIEFVKKGILNFLNKKQFHKIQSSNIVHFSSLFFPPTLPFLFYSLIKKKKIIISPRGELYSTALKFKPLRKKIWISIIKLFQSKINFLATCSEEKSTIQSIFPKARRIDVIPNFISLPIKLDLPIKNQLLYLGRINPIKNIDILIKSFSSIIKNSKKTDLKLLIVGAAQLEYEKNYKKKLELLVSELNLNEQVVFLGEITGVEKEKTIASSLVLILPSKSENFGNVVTEALSQGTPVIASKNTPWKNLEDNNVGFWIEPNEDQLKLAIEKILNMQESSYKLLRSNAHSYCKNTFDITTKIGIWIDYYNII